MLMYLPERIYEVIQDDPRIQQYETEMKELWGVGFPEVNQLQKVNQVGFHYMCQARRLLRGYPNLLEQFHVSNRENDTMYVKSVLETTLDKETKLECLYRLMSSWIDRDTSIKEFIRLFESLNLNELFDLSANIVKAYYIMKTSTIEAHSIEEYIKKANTIYTQIAGVCKMTKSLEKMIIVESIDQLVAHLRDKLIDGSITAEKALSIYDNNIVRIIHKMEQIDAEYLKYNTRSLYLYLIICVKRYEKDRDMNRAFDLVYNYIIFCLKHKEESTRSLYTHNEFMFSHLAVLLNAIHMIVPEHKQKAIEDYLDDNELDYLVGLSSNGKLSNYIANKLRSVNADDFGVAVLKYFESDVYTLIEPILIDKTLEG